MNNQALNGLAILPRFPKLVLFDLDGTLLDSAPDFVATINALRAASGVRGITQGVLRPHVSRGSRAMLAAAFPELDAETREAMVPAFLAQYRLELARHGAPFDGIPALLDAIEAAGCRWGIVTNKPEALARLLLPLLGWESRCAVLVGGDTLAVHKPDPEPLLHAARMLGVDAVDCAYVGDDARDIAASRAAAMHSVVALWGYRGEDENPADWQADAMAVNPRDLLEWPVPL